VASAFGTRRDQAERMKCLLGSATASPRDNHEMIEVAPLSADDEAVEGTRITRAQLIAVIRQRLEHLSSEIGKALKDLGFSGPVGRQVVLTGGGAELKGIADYMQAALGRAVRIGRPRGLAGLPEAHSGSGFATLAGLIHYAASDPIDVRAIQPNAQLIHKTTPGGVFNRLLAAFKSGY
jgi:cell division protein FtsA